MPVIMDPLWELPLATSAAGGLLVWALMRSLCQRRVARWANRLLKSEAKLEASRQQLVQARKQVEKLQRELSEARRAAAVASSQLGSQRAATVPPRTAPSSSPAPSPDSGFADTMPM